MDPRPQEEWDRRGGDFSPPLNWEAGGLWYRSGPEEAVPTQVEVLFMQLWRDVVGTVG